ncbi:hypothetical protein OSTOST_16686 [Ostertagia ostertagi]
MRVLVHAVLVAARVNGLLGQQHKSYLLATPERRQELLERRIRRSDDEKQRKMGDTIEEINKNSGVAGSLYQGDIVLTKEQQDQVGIRSKRQAMIDLNRRWPNKTVPYILYLQVSCSQFSAHTSEKLPEIPPLSLDNKREEAFKKASQLWMDDTCIDCKEYPDPIKTKINPTLTKARTSQI